MKIKKLILVIIIVIIVLILMSIVLLHQTKLFENAKSTVSKFVAGDTINNENPDMIVDITNIINDAYPEHEHVWYEEYDETNHWSKCSICKDESEHTAHTLTTTWALGKESCAEKNSYKSTCPCGYGTTGRKPCVWNGTWESLYLGYNQHDRRCVNCNKRIYDRPYIDNTKGGILVPENTDDIFTLGLSERTKCVLSDGTVRPCGSSQNCTICGGPKFKNGTHIYVAAANNIIRCQACGKEGGTYEMEMLSSSGGKKEVKQMRAKLYATSSDIKFSGNPSTARWSIATFTCKNSKTTVSSDGKEATVTWDLASDTNEGKEGVWSLTVMSNVAIYGRTPYITQKPNIDVSIDNLIDGWNRSTKAKINITEVYSDSADVSIFSNGIEKLKRKYRISNDSIVDEIELNGLGIENGSKIEWVVTLPGGTEARTEMDMTNIDVTGPLLNTDLEVQGRWTKTRNLNVNYHDEGVGNDRVYLANTDYIYGIQEGEDKENVLFELTGDVYSEKELNVFAVDSLGNYTVKTITVNNLDNTKPTISKAQMQGDKLVINSNDEKEGLGEGSGVSKYRYITSLEKLENPEITAENSIEVSKDNEIILENLSEANFIYVIAEDRAGNISDVYELRLQKLVLKSKVNLNLAEGKGGVELDWSDYDIAGVYFAIYRKEETEENFEKIEDNFTNNTYTDILANDKSKPVAPIVNINTNSSEIQLDLSSSDNGTTYTYYVEVYDISTNALLKTSNKESVKI